MSQIFTWEDKTECRNGHQGYIRAEVEAHGVRITIRQHGGGWAGETILIPVHQAHELAEALTEVLLFTPLEKAFGEAVKDAVKGDREAVPVAPPPAEPLRKA